jgi:hypothetical protein
MSCPSNKCCMSKNPPCCKGARPRCDYWTSSPYCWCSYSCCLNNYYGYYSCCDCWTGGSGNCEQSGGTSPCVCKHRHLIREC